MLAASLAMALGTILIRFTCTKSDPVAVTGWHMIFGSIPLIVRHCFQTDFQILVRKLITFQNYSSKSFYGPEIC